MLAAGAVVGAALGCAGAGADLGDVGAPADAPVDTPRPPGARLPERVEALVPVGVAPTRVESGDDPLTVHLPLGSLDPIAAWWDTRAGAAVTRLTAADGRPERVVGAMWDLDRVKIAVAELEAPDSVVVRVHRSIPDLGLERGACGERQVGVRAAWPEGGEVETCVSLGGEGRPVGPFKVERYGIAIVSGTYDDTSARAGVWTLRTDGDSVAATGAFEHGTPIGGWLFVQDGTEHQVLYVDGAPTELPVSLLPIAGSDPRPYARAALEVLDADLATGLIAARLRFVLAPDPATGSGPRACPGAGRDDPAEGVRLLLLRAGYRAPVGDWLVWDSTSGGADCTPDEAATAATEAARAAFVASGLDPARGIKLAPVDGSDPFDATGARLSIAGHTVSVIPAELDLSYESQLASPELLEGVWASTADQQVRRANVLVDEVPLGEDLWMRWPTGCAGGASVIGAITGREGQPPWFALVVRSEACAGGGPLYTVLAPMLAE